MRPKARCSTGSQTCSLRSTPRSYPGGAAERHAIEALARASATQPAYLRLANQVQGSFDGGRPPSRARRGPEAYDDNIRTDAHHVIASAVRYESLIRQSECPTI